MSDDRVVIVLRIQQSAGVLSRVVAVLIRFGLEYESHQFATIRTSGVHLAILNARGTVDNSNELRSRLEAVAGVLAVAELRYDADGGRRTSRSGQLRPVADRFR